MSSAQATSTSPLGMDFASPPRHWLRRGVSQWHHAMSRLRPRQYVRWRRSSNDDYARFKVSKAYGGSAYDIDRVDSNGHGVGERMHRVALTEANYGVAWQVETDALFQSTGLRPPSS